MMINQNGSQTCIMIVVDEPMLAADLNQRLNRLGYTLTARVTEGKYALAEAESIRPDIVFIDAHLSGDPDCVKTTCLLQRHLRLPIVFIIGQEDEETLKRLKETQPYGFLYKPVRDPELKALTQMALIEEKAGLDCIEDTIHRCALEWQSTFDAIYDPVSLIDAQGLILQCNRAMMKFLDKPLKEIIGRHCWELVHGTDGPIPECPLERARETRQRETLLLPVRGCTYSVTVDPIFDDQDRLISAAHIMTDVTEQKKAEQVLKESEKTYRDIFTAMMDGLFVIDFKGFILDVNPMACTTFGYGHEEMVGLQVTRLIRPDYYEAFDRFVARVRAGRKFCWETIGLRKEGTEIVAEVRGSLIEISGERRLLGIVRDVSERRRAEKERELLIGRLEDALSEVKMLRGYLPICASCKKIRDDDGYWQQVEKYISEHSGIRFSHGICPDCARELYPDLFKNC